jgi:HSP20 family protein
MKMGNGQTAVPSPKKINNLVDDLFSKSLNRFFDDSFFVGTDGLLGHTQVPVNVRETDTTYELQLPAPGLKKSDFKVAVNGEELTISFEQKEEHNQQNNGWLRQEYRQQSFSRSFTLDDTVDANKINAQYTDGMLHVVVPKKEGAQKLLRTIEIK